MTMRHGATRGRVVRKSSATKAGGDSIGSGNQEGGNPYVYFYRQAIKEGLIAAQGKPARTLRDMSPAERAAIEAEYGAPIKERE